MDSRILTPQGMAFAFRDFFNAWTQPARHPRPTRGNVRRGRRPSGGNKKRMRKTHARRRNRIARRSRRINRQRARR